MADQEITRILSAASHFEVLQVAHSGATDAEVKKQYRVLALQTHPDKNKHERAEEAFKRVTGAFQSLETREKRDRYHASGGRGFRHHSEEEDDVDFGHDAHAFFNVFMQMHMGSGRGGGMEQVMFMMMMEQMMNRGGVFVDEYGGFYEEDDEYYDDGEYFDDDEYFDDEEEEEYGLCFSPSSHKSTLTMTDDRPGRFNRELQKYVCEKCHVHTTTREEMIEHLQGKRHGHAMEQEDFFCETCQLRTTTKTAKQNHLSGNKHLRNLRSSSAKRI